LTRRHRPRGEELPDLVIKQPIVIACDKREAFAQGSKATKQSRLFAIDPGLLRFARNDVNDAQFDVPAAQSAPEPCMSVAPLERTEGAGKAGRADSTRSLVCESEKHTSKSPQVHRKRSGLPCAMVLTAYFVLATETGLCCLRRQRDAKHHRQLDISVGISGPHDFAVRWNITRQLMFCCGHCIPSCVRDDRDTPLLMRGGTSRLMTDVQER